MQCKGRIRSVTIAEMLFSMALIGIFLIISAPLISIRAKMQGQDLASIMCIKNVLAADANETISESACASKPNNPCCKAVKSCRYDQNNACFTLQYYADNGNTTEQINGKKALSTVCNQGGREGCRYFAVSCNRDNSTCNNESNDYDLQYYLNLPVSSSSAAKKPIADIAGTLYNEGSPNITYWVNNTCSDYSTSLACYIQGVDTAPVLPTSFQMALTPPNYIIPQAMKANPNTGDVYISGEYYWNHGGSTNYSDALLIKMNSSGNMTAPYGFQKLVQSSYATYNNTVGGGIGIDSSNNVYWGIETWVSASNVKAIGVIKMNSSGNMTAPYGWQMQLKEASLSGQLFGDGLTVGPDDNIYITTYDLKETLLTRDATVIRMNSSGNITLQRRIDSSSGSAEYGYGIAVDGAGNIYVIGASQNNGTKEGTSDADIMAIKMNSLGNMTSPYGWQTRINSSNKDYDCGLSIALDSAHGYLYIGGASWISSYDLAILQLNTSNGSVGFQHRMAYTYGGYDWIRGLDIDSDGNIYAVGETQTSSSNNDLIVMKMNMSGNMTAPYGWQMMLSGTSTTKKFDTGQDIVVGNDGFIYVTGSIQTQYNNAGRNADLFILKMNMSQTSNMSGFSYSAPWSNIVTNKLFFDTAPNYVITYPFTVYDTPVTTTSNPGYTFN